ncbi:MAG: type II toxin-antitoxin system Phd/YefM family antitoxin [Burkholderiales bacterium]
MGGNVGARELKTRLGRYLRRVRRGERLVVTDRGEPIAELRPLASRASATDPGLLALEALGVLTRPSKGRLTPFRPLRSSGRPAAEAVAEGREDRF